MLRLICLIAALICFLIVTFGGNGGRVNLLAGGLALLVASFLVSGP